MQAQVAHSCQSKESTHSYFEIGSAILIMHDAVEAVIGTLSTDGAAMLLGHDCAMTIELRGTAKPALLVPAARCKQGTCSIRLKKNEPAPASPFVGYC